MRKRAHVHVIENELSVCVQTELAAFLIGMGQYSYFVCGAWENYVANRSTWNPVYDLPLGAPRSNAVLGEDGVWRRAFASGTAATFDTKRERGTVSWARRGFGAEFTGR